MSIAAFLSHSPGLLNWAPGGPASLGHGLHSSIFSPTHLISNCLTSCLHMGYIIIWRPLFFLQASQFRTHSTCSRSRLYPDIPWPDAPFIYTGAFPILTAWPGSIYYRKNLKKKQEWKEWKSQNFIYVVFIGNPFEMRLLNLRIIFFFLFIADFFSFFFCPHLGSFFLLFLLTTFQPNFTSGLLRCTWDSG